MYGDPFWLTAKYSSLCQQCKDPIKKGSQIFYYPRGKIALCEKCGRIAERDFRMMVDYEEGVCRG